MPLSQDKKDKLRKFQRAAEETTKGRGMEAAFDELQDNPDGVQQQPDKKAWLESKGVKLPKDADAQTTVDVVPARATRGIFCIRICAWTWCYNWCPF
jgi:hypothetical protein